MPNQRHFIAIHCSDLFLVQLKWRKRFLLHDISSACIANLESPTDLADSTLAIFYAALANLYGEQVPPPVVCYGVAHWNMTEIYSSRSLLSTMCQKMMALAVKLVAVGLPDSSSRVQEHKPLSALLPSSLVFFGVRTAVEWLQVHSRDAMVVTCC